ncbi:cell division protein [Corynebacterium sp. HMSC071B10]|nr:cell division protein [Corynebacterium sp. HMSC071B10]
MASVGVSLLVLAGIAAAMPFTPMMPVHGVNVDGNAALSPEQVEELTGIVPETPMGRVDVRAAAEGVAANPWVKSATVKRDWPSSIQVDVEEYTAVAFVALEDGTHLIDAEGKDFLIADPPPGAMELVGPGIEDEEGKRAAVEIAASISEKARGQVEGLDARGPYEYVLRLREGRTVVWGAAEDNANKALALESVLQMEGTEFNISNPELVTSR